MAYLRINSEVSINVDMQTLNGLVMMHTGDYSDPNIVDGVGFNVSKRIAKDVLENEAADAIQKLIDKARRVGKRARA
jgi:hypothetical protein